MLCNYYTYNEIIKKYPKLSRTFLTNINTGLNFKRDDLEYPLLNYHTSFKKEIQDQIFNELINNIPYPIISKKYNISISLLSGINSGKRWNRKELNYPLSIRIKSDDWTNNCIKDAIFTNLSNSELAKKYNVSEATIGALVQGQHHHKNNLIYPLKQNKKQN